MKLRKFAIVFIAVVLLLTMTGCNSVGFLSEGQINKLVSEYGKPQVEMVVEYTLNEHTTRLEIVYNLEVEKAPITVANFINLVNKEYYNNVVFDSRISSTTNSWIAGRYLYKDGEDREYNYYQTEDVGYTILGEFYQNGWQLPVDEADKDNEEITDGNAKFSLFSLAMYHESSVASFDKASTAFFLTTSSTQTENYKNYAVFATLASISVYVDDVLHVENATEVPSSVLYDFNNNSAMSTTTTRKVVTGTDDEGNEQTTSRTMLRDPIVIKSITMVGDKDFTNYPHYVIEL